mgnify:CR=1 FL=1
MERTAEITIEFSDSKITKTLYRTLLPEIMSAPTFKTKVNIVFLEQKIKITIEADTTSSLRAALNSYLSWISSILKTLKHVR